MNDINIFLDHASNLLQKDERIIALCVGGSWITNEIDKYSDLDLVVITRINISNSKKGMENIAASLGTLLAGFTGEHVSENRLLICLYENPVLHVDLKFLQINEFDVRVENPIIIWEREKVITKLYESTLAKWTFPDYQWIEDRFWVWIHYAAAKLDRGELFETIDFLSFLRINVIGPLFHIKYKSLPRGVRKLEFILSDEDMNKLMKTVPVYSFESIKASVYQTINLYRELREQLFDPGIVRLQRAESISMLSLDNVKK